MSVVIALTGASGNMGRECLRQLLELEEVEKVKILLRRSNKDKQFASAAKRAYGKRAEIVFGDLADAESCRELVAGTQYVFHVGAARSSSSAVENKLVNPHKIREKSILEKVINLLLVNQL